MIKSPCSKTILIYLIGGILLTCPILGHADSGTDGPGNAGIDKCTGELAEQVRAELARPFDPTKDPLSGSAFLNILTLAHNINRDFEKALRISLKKNWRFDIPADGFKICHAENPNFESSPIYEKVACQKSSDIIVNPLYWETLDMDSCKKPETDDDKKKLAKNHLAVIVHEALLGFTLGTKLTDDDTINVFGDLIQPQINIEKLRQDLKPLMPYIKEALKRQDGQVPCDPTQDATPQAPPGIIQSANAASNFLSASKMKPELCQNLDLRSISPGTKCKTSKGALFQLLARTDNHHKEVWKDLKAGIIWSDLLINQDDSYGRYNLDAAETACSSDVSTFEARGGKQLGDVQFRLPKGKDFKTAIADGFAEVLPNMFWHTFWSDTRRSIDGYVGADAYYIPSANESGLNLSTSDKLNSVRCIGGK